MPIQFRCRSCNQKLAISRRKAGKVVKCPACAADIEVPTLEEAIATGKLIDSPDSERTPPPSPPPPPPPAKQSPPPPPSEQSPPAPVNEPPVEESSPAETPLFDDVAASVFDDLDDLDESDDDIAPPPVVAAAVASPVETNPEEPSHPAPVAPSAAIASEPGHRHWADEDEEEDDEFQLARKPADESGLDMTPMVDVTFLLLIFFMITASFSVQKSMEAEAPEPDDDGAAQMPSMDDLADDSVIVEIDENDTIYVDDVQVGTIGEVIDALAQKVSAEKKLEMVIEAHPLSKHGTVVQVTDAGVEVGMQRIRRVTRKGE